MPRASYTLKNRFCFNSNQSEWAYLKVLYFWLRGETFSDIEKLLPLESHQFDWVMERVNELKPIDKPIERDEPVKLSRQSCHRIIDQFAEHYIQDHITGLRKRFGAFDDSLADQPDAIPYPAIRKVLRILKRLSLTNWANSAFRKNLEEMSSETLNESAWKQASGNINHDAFKVLPGVPSVATIMDDMSLYLIQDRYRRFRGYNREKMTPHTVYQMLTIQLAQQYYRRFKKKPERNAADMTEREIENWRTNIAMEALGYIVWKLANEPVRAQGSNESTPSSPSSNNR